MNPQKKQNNCKKNGSMTSWPAQNTSTKKYLPASNHDSIVYKSSKNEDIFGPENVDIGGVGLALEHGSILIENSRY